MTVHLGSDGKPRGAEAIDLWRFRHAQRIAQPPAASAEVYDVYIDPAEPETPRFSPETASRLLRCSLRAFNKRGPR